MEHRAPTLGIDESMELAHAWIQRLADSQGIRVLFIKGPSLHLLDLRPFHISSDVDIMVHPDDFPRMCATLEKAGWRPREAGFLLDHIAHHSRTYLSDRWPCDIDIHRRFPGFLTAQEEVFEILWEDRTVLRYADHDCTTTGRNGSALVLALHALRSLAQSTRHNQELEYLLSAPFTISELQELGRLASRTGCTEPLEAILAQLNAPSHRDKAPLDIGALRDWKVRTDVRENGIGAYAWLKLVLDAPLSNKPTVLWRAIWPTDSDLTLHHPDLPSDPAARNRIRRKRLISGIRALPHVVRSIVRNRRAGGDTPQHL